ncbi:MAG: spondin domain-containing protein [Leptolyngbyaceae cyanobacterium MO_188.B28]|nr:spondin domain-containing protein [Leptolyngbyaceae cyanobacterium MO_188.B28]
MADEFTPSINTSDEETELTPFIDVTALISVEDAELVPPVVISDGETQFIREDIQALAGQPAVDIPGDQARLIVARDGSISAPDAGNTAVQASGEKVAIANLGSIFGDLNGVSSTGDNLGLLNLGVIQSNSRAVDLSDGDGIVVLNSGSILGTGNQRNGTLYVDGTVDDLKLVNTRHGVIDAGAGNLGDAVSVQVGAIGDPSSEDIDIVNEGLLQGRGDGPEVFADGARVAANGSSGLRFFNGSGQPEATVTGSVINRGVITSEVNVGFLGGLVVEDGVAFEGRIVNDRGSLISGPRNGLYIGDAEHDLKIVNSGQIESGSRAVNLDGDNVTLVNRGDILGVGDQRNGTVYLDGTADNITVNNRRRGVIDAGEGNSGSGVSIQVGAADGFGEGADDLETSANLVNRGLIQGRGQGNVPAGVRLFVGSGLSEATFTGDITNQGSGVIASEQQAGVLIESGVIFNGQITNRGVISGGNGFAIDADGALGSVNILNQGVLEGEVRLGSGDDRFIQSSQDGVVVTGGLGDDDIRGGRGDDTLEGGAGNDFIAGGGGVDTLDGGEGVDTNSFFNIGAEVVADLATGSASYQPNVAAGITVFENFANFENLDGSAQDDQLFGDGGDNVLTGNDGDDLLVGRGGGDTLEGGLGNDILRGGGGNDITDGGEGVDTADFQDIGVNVEANLATGQAQYVVNGNQVQDQLIDIENLTGSTNDDTLIGDDNDNLLAGNAGDDTLIGGAGNDVLRGDEVGSGSAIRVTVTNTLGAGGTFLTPIWFGFHDGANFDLFDLGASASTGLERLAEDGSIEGIAAEFNAQVGGNGVDGTIVGGLGVPGPIDPGESASFTLDVDPTQVGQGFFTWATMVIPSNDAFLAVPDNALADPIFDQNGNFIGPLVIERRGSDVLDAGTEINTEEDAAFLNQLARDTGLDENGVVASHPGFNGSVGNPNGAPVNILGGTTAPGATIDPIVGDFTADDDLLLRIVIEQVAVANTGNDNLQGGLGDDTLEGGGGDDILTGGLGRDTFIFGNSAGINTITDFSIEDDFIDVSSLFDDFQDVLGSSSQEGDNAVIDFGDNNSVQLVGVEVNALSSNNFVFA